MYSACNIGHHHKNTLFCYQPLQDEKHPFPLVYLTSVNNSTPIWTSQFIQEVLETCNAFLIFKIKNRKIKILAFSSYTLSAPRHMRTWIWQFLVSLTEPAFLLLSLNWGELYLHFYFYFWAGSLPLCTCLPGYTGNGYGPNGCMQLSNMCLSHPCSNGQCVVSPLFFWDDRVLENHNFSFTSMQYVFYDSWILR